MKVVKANTEVDLHIRAIEIFHFYPKITFATRSWFRFIDSIDLYKVYAWRFMFSKFDELPVVVDRLLFIAR